MGRLIDADAFEKFIKEKYKDGESTDDIKDQMLFDLSYQPTAYDVDKAEKERKALQNRCKTLSNGTICGSCSMKCENRTMPFLFGKAGGAE